MNRERSQFGCGFGVFVLIIAIIFALIANGNTANYTVKVTDKDRVNTRNSSYYLVFCHDETNNEYHEFKCADSLLRGKFDSSRWYNQIEIGKTYKFTVNGFRIPLFSSYQNIIDFEEVKNE